MMAIAIMNYCRLCGQQKDNLTCIFEKEDLIENIKRYLQILVSWIYFTYYTIWCQIGCGIHLVTFIYIIFYFRFSKKIPYHRKYVILVKMKLYTLFATSMGVRKLKENFINCHSYKKWRWKWPILIGISTYLISLCDSLRIES